VKALTVCQPYADNIAVGTKWVENRTWCTHYRGLLAIHAGKSSRFLGKGVTRDYPTGAVVAVTEIIACVSIEWLQNQPLETVIPGTDLTVADVLRHDHTEGPWCWILTKTAPLKTIVPCRGRQGLWDWQGGTGCARDWYLKNGRAQ